MAAVLAAGFPLVAFLQVMRVYGNSLRQVADAEARLFRIYVHEPLVMDGVPATQVAEELAELIADLLPLDHAADGRTCTATSSSTPSSRTCSRPWRRDLERRREALGQLRVAICFADLVGYVQFTEEAGRGGGARPGRALRRCGRGDAARRAPAW